MIVIILNIVTLICVALIAISKHREMNKLKELDKTLDNYSSRLYSVSDEVSKINKEREIEKCSEKVKALVGKKVIRKTYKNYDFYRGTGEEVLEKFTIQAFSKEYVYILNEDGSHGHIDLFTINQCELEEEEQAQ